MTKTVRRLKMAPASVKYATAKALKPSFDNMSLEGWKTIIGVVLVTAAHAIDATADLMVLLPDNESLQAIHGILTQVVPYLEKALRYLSDGAFGSGALLTIIGIIGKIRKFTGAIWSVISHVR